MTRFTRVGWRVLLAVCGVAATTSGISAIGGLNVTTVGFIYLLLVLVIASFAGLAEATAASVAAMLCYNYFFLPPIGQFSIADLENWVALFAFLITALVASHLSERAKQQARVAKRGQLEMEQLYALSRAIILADPAEPIGSRVAQQISQIFGATGVVLFDAQTGSSFQGGPAEITGIEDTIKRTVLQGSRCHAQQKNVEVWPISLGGHSQGALAVEGLETSDGAMQSLLNLMAIAIERVRAEKISNRAEAARQSDEFKSTLLDGVAHEFKTPLTSIKAAATALLESAKRYAPEERELLSVIDEETDRLTSLVTEAVRVSQIDAGEIRLEGSPHAVEEILQHAILSFNSRAEGRIRGGHATKDRIFADRDMIVLALRQLIDNALKYAAPATGIRVWADHKGGRVFIHVADQGPGIPARDRERIFEKFFRREKDLDGVPGSGLGLHVAREIARMHGGDLWVEAAESGGSDFCLAIPVLAEVEA